MNKNRILILIALLSLCRLPAGNAVDEFDVQAVVRHSEIYPALLAVNVRVPPGHRLYSDDFSVSVEPEVLLKPIMSPAPVPLEDGLTGAIKPVWTSDFSVVFAFESLPVTEEIKVKVGYLGCDESICFLPQTVELTLELPDGLVGVSEVPVEQSTAAEDSEEILRDSSTEQQDWRSYLRKFQVRASASGYMNVEEFLKFLGEAESDSAPVPSVDIKSDKNIWWLLALIVLGGVALNFTPCVLPMIPVNLAIIGAGVQRPEDGENEAGAVIQRRRRGLLMGGLYGVGITLAYGGLGVFVVAAGGVFGAINSTAWFNLAVAGLFLVMALAMFDIITVDFSRWQSRLHVAGGSRLAVLLMGALSAILAGACVAPVVITVLVQALALYSEGRTIAGLTLPFLLGLGMALPWPFVGAGLAVLPRPGKWMNKVKYLLGVLILALSVYYAWQGWKLLPHANRNLDTAPAGVESGTSGWQTEIHDALRQAAREGRPVLVDFWASWCKSCKTMDATTLRDTEVRRRLEGFVLLKYQAEHPDRLPAREVLEKFSVLGLPTFVILYPRL